MAKIVYYRSAKVGSSSICKAIKNSKYKTAYIRNKLDLNKLDNSFEIVVVGVDPSRELLYEKIQSSLNGLDNYVSFGVSRCPYSKFVSSFIYCHITSEFMDTFMRDEKVIKKNTHLWSHAFRTQTEALYYKGKLAPKYILRFEGLKSNVDSFFNEYGYDIKIPHLNRSSVKQGRKKEILNKYMSFIEDRFRDDFLNFDYPMILKG